MSTQRPSCDNCYFHRHGLCALALGQPCPTYRAAGAALQPPRQAPLVAREPLAAAAAPAAVFAAA